MEPVIENPIAGEEGDEYKAESESFRTNTEVQLAACDKRLKKLENAGPKTGETDEEGNSIAGKVRTFEQRILQVETLQAENTSNILRLSEMVQSQLAGANARIAALESAVSALKPQP